MNPTSRSPRLHVVGRKTLRRRKPAKRKSTPFGDVDRIDCESLRTALALLNAGKTNRHPQWISHKTLARFAEPLGGAGHRQQWYDYVNPQAKRRIPEIDKLIATVFFRRYRVQELFPSWRFSALTPFPPDMPIPALLHALMAMDAAEQKALNRVNELYLAATREQREAIIRSAHAVMGAPIPK